MKILYIILIIAHALNAQILETPLHEKNFTITFDDLGFTDKGWDYNEINTPLETEENTQKVSFIGLNCRVENEKNELNENASWDGNELWSQGDENVGYYLSTKELDSQCSIIFDEPVNAFTMRFNGELTKILVLDKDDQLLETLDTSLIDGLNEYQVIGYASRLDIIHQVRFEAVDDVGFKFHADNIEWLKCDDIYKDGSCQLSKWVYPYCDISINQLDRI